MHTSTDKEPLARNVKITAQRLTVELKDGRVMSVPLEWYPRLANGLPRERNNWSLWGEGDAIHWPDLDEDLSVGGIVAGRRSMEGRKSFKRWIEWHRRKLRGEKFLRYPNEILNIMDVKVVGPYELRVEFSTGEVRDVNVRPLLRGKLKPLLDPKRFARARVIPDSYSVGWPNGAELSPDALYELEGISSKRKATVGRHVRRMQAA